MIMNILPSQANFTITSYPIEFQQIIQEKTQNFVDRPFIFNAIKKFLYRHNCGYFTIVGAPGCGKSAILAKYVINNPSAVYYNAQVADKNHADKFLRSVCKQLMQRLDNGDTVLPDNVTEGSWFLSLLLQRISNKLKPNQNLIITIDALDAININHQPPGSNVFYLPKYLPQGVYFVLAQRPYLREKSGIFIETPSQILNLAAYPEQSQIDTLVYIRQYLTLLKGLQEKSHIDNEQLITYLSTESEGNFMYLSQILPSIANGFYPEALHRHRLSRNLEIYYQQHWQKIKAQGLSSTALEVLYVLTSIEKGKKVSVKAITEVIGKDEYEVEEVLENWLEFLVQQKVSTETHYCFYHDSFRDWLAEQLVNPVMSLSENNN